MRQGLNGFSLPQGFFFRYFPLSGSIMEYQLVGMRAYALCTSLDDAWLNARAGECEPLREVVNDLICAVQSAMCHQLIKESKPLPGDAPRQRATGDHPRTLWRSA